MNERLVEIEKELLARASKLTAGATKLEKGEAKNLLFQEAAKIYQKLRNHICAGHYYKEADMKEEAKREYISAQEFNSALDIEEDPLKKQSLECRAIENWKENFLVSHNYTGSLSDSQDEENMRDTKRYGRKLTELADKYEMLPAIYVEGFTKECDGLSWIVAEYLLSKGRKEELQRIRKKFGKSPYE